MSRYTIPRSHGVNCICHTCQVRRRKERPEAERPRRVPAEEVNGIVLEARRRGATFREISEASGLALGTVHRIIRGGVLVDPQTQAALEELEIVDG
jgi:IclR helix-turn-helix domain